MKENSCDIVMDLLPLYVDGELSSGSTIYVEKHLNTCEKCRKEYELMSREFNIPVDNEVHLSPVSQMKKRYFNRLVKAIGLTIVAMAAIVGCIGLYLARPVIKGFALFDESNLTIFENNGSVFIIPDDEGSNRQLRYLYQMDDNGKGILYISYGGLMEQYKDALRTDPVKETIRWQIVPWNIGDSETGPEGGTLSEDGIAGAALTLDDMERVLVPESINEIYYLSNISDEEQNSWMQLIQCNGSEMSTRTEKGIVTTQGYDFGQLSKGELIWER